MNIEYRVIEVQQYGKVWYEVQSNVEPSPSRPFCWRSEERIFDTKVQAFIRKKELQHLERIERVVEE